MSVPLRHIDKKLAEFKQRGIVPKNTNVQEFSQWANEATGTNDFSAGDIGKIGRGARALNQFMNEKINTSTPVDLLKAGTKMVPGVGQVMPFVTQAVDKVTGGALSDAPNFLQMGEGLGGFAGKLVGNEELGREVGQKLPRGAANMAPALLAPFTGGQSLWMYGATGAAQGLDTYGETGSVPRAALSGATAAVMPKVMEKTLSATMPFVANQIGNVGAKIASVPVSAGAGFGLGIASDVGDIAMAPERSFGEMGQKEYWQAHGVGQLAFLPLDVQQAFMLKLPSRAGTPPPLPNMPPSLPDFNPQRVGSSVTDRIDVNFRSSDEFRVSSDMVEFAQKPMELINVEQPPKQRMAPRFDNMQGTRNAIGEVEGDLLVDFGITQRKESPIVQFRKDAAQIINDLPPVPEGSTRLYRGNRANGADQGNPSYTNSLEGIALPFRKAYGGELTYVDVPTAELDNYMSKAGAAPGAEFMLPPELVAQTKIYQPSVPKEVSDAQAKIDSGAMEPETLIKNEPEIYNEIERKQTQDATSSLGQKLEPDTIPYQGEQLPKVAEIVETRPTTLDEVTQQIKSVNKERAEQGQNPVDDLQLQEIVKSHVDAGDDNQTAVIKTVQTIKNEALRLTELQQNNFSIEQAAQVAAIKDQNFSEVQTMLEVNPSHPLAKSLGEFITKGSGGKGGPFDFRHADSEYFNDIKVAVQERLTRPLDQLKSNNVEMTRFTDELKLIKKRAKDRLATIDRRKQRKVDKPYHDVEGTIKILEDNGLDQMVGEKVGTKASWLERQGGLSRVDEQNELWKVVGIWARQKGYAENLKGSIDKLNTMLYSRTNFLVRARFHNAKEAGLIPIDQQYAERRQSDMLDAQHIDDTAEDGYDAMILHRVIKHNNEFLTGAENIIKKNEKGRWVIGRENQVVAGGVLDEQAFKNWFQRAGGTPALFEAAKIANPGIIDGAGKVDLEAFTNTVSDPEFVRTQEHLDKTKFDHSELLPLEADFSAKERAVMAKEHEFESVIPDSEQRYNVINLLVSYAQKGLSFNELGDFAARLQESTRRPGNIQRAVEGAQTLLKLPEQDFIKAFEVFQARKEFTEASRVYQERLSALEGTLRDDSNFAAKWGDIAPDTYTEFNPKTGLGNTAVEVRVKGLEGANGHTGNTDTLLWVRGKFIDHNGKRIYRVDEIQSDAAQTYFKEINIIKNGELGPNPSAPAFGIKEPNGATRWSTIELNDLVDTKGTTWKQHIQDVRGIGKFGQIDIEQTRKNALARYQKENYHPFYDHINQIALRTAIQHAGKTGATEIFLPSAKTAMFSEGHQFATYQKLKASTGYESGLMGVEGGKLQNREFTFFNRPVKLTGTYSLEGSPKGFNFEFETSSGIIKKLPLAVFPKEFQKEFLDNVKIERENKYQGGMEYAYDNKIPAGMEKLVGKGEKFNLGEHKNPPIKDDPTFSDNSITGTLYKIKPLYDQFKDLGGTPLFGRPESNNAFVQRHPIERLAMANGYSPEQARAHAPFIKAVTNLFENLTGQKLKIGEIIGRSNNGDMVAGLANRSAIHKAIFLNPELEPNLAGFTAAHEAIGHHMLNMHKAGLLDPEMSRSIVEVNDFWTKLPQSDREDFFRNYGPELLGKDLYSKVAETLQTTAADPQESMANLMAMLSKDSVSKFLTMERLSFLPQPVMNFVLKAMQFAKDMFRVAKSWVGMRNMLGDVDKEQFKTLWDFERTFSDQYKKISAENYKLTREAYKLGQLFPGGRDGEGYAGKVLAEMLDFNGNEAVNMVADAMLIPGWSQARSGMKKLSEFLEPTLNKLARYPIVQKHAGLATFVEQQLGHMIDNAQVDFLFRDPSKPKNTGGFGYMPKGGPVMEIFNDLKPDGLHHRFNELWRLQNQSKDVFLDGTNIKDPQFKSVVDGLSDTQIKTMLDANLRFRDAIKFTNGKIVESLKKELEVNISRIARKKNVGLTQDEVYRLGTELFDAYTKGRLNVAQDPYPFKAFDDLIVRNGLDGEVLTQYITKRMEGIDKIEAFYQEFPHYTPIKEYRQFQVSYSEKGSTSVHRFSTDSIDAVTNFVNQSKKLGRTLHYEGQGFIDSHASFGSNRRPSQIMEQLLDAAQDQSLIQLINQMKTNNQIDEKTRIDLVAGIDLWRSAIDAELEGGNPGKMIPKDDNKIPRENLDFFEQNLMYMNKVSRLVPRMVTDAVFKVEKFNPEISGDPVQERMLEELNKHIANYRMPDSALGRSFVRGNFLHMMLGNISTIALELSQFPISLSHVMTRNGSGLFDSYRLPMKAIKNLIPYYLQGESGFNSGISLRKANGKVVDAYAQLMERGVQDKSIGFGKNQEALEQMEHVFYNLGRIAEGKSIMGSQEIMKKVWANLFTMGAKLYQIGPAFNERLTYLSLFDMVHKQKFGGKKTLNNSDFEAIYQDVWRLAKEANQSAGRFQRPMGLFNQGSEWRTIPMMMHSLNTYNSGLLSSLYNDLRVGFFGKELKGFSPKQRNQHKLAAFQAFSTLVAGAGVVGALPFVDSFLKLLEDKTDLNPRQAIKDGMMELGGEEWGPFLSDLSTHGLAYAMGAPFDMSSRLAIGGLLGLNPYEGWSAKAMMGPTASRIEDYLNAGGNVLKGNLTGAVEKALPIGLRKGYTLLTKDGRFTDNKGQDMLGQPSFAEQAMYSMGFMPSRLSALREDQRMQQVNERINVERNNRFYRQMVEKISKEGYASIQQDVMQYAEENQGLSQQSIYSGIEEFLTRQRLGFDPRHTGTRQGSAQRTKNLQQLQGKGLPEISASQRAMAKIQEMMSMGQPVGDIGQTMKTAMLTDMFQRNGNLSFAQASQQAQLLTSLSYSRQNPQMQLPFLGE